MATTANNLKIYKTGDAAYVDVCFVYPGPGKKEDVTISVDGLDNPAITVTSVDVSKGIFDIADGEWILASLIPGKEYCATVYFTIEDTCALKDGISFTLDDNCGCGPDACVTFTGIGCCDLLPCVEEILCAVEPSCDAIGTH